MLAGGPKCGLQPRALTADPTAVESAADAAACYHGGQTTPVIAPVTAINQGTAQEMPPILLRERFKNFYTSCSTSVNKAARSIEGGERREEDQLISDTDKDYSSFHSHIDKPHMSIARTGEKAQGHRGRPDNDEVSKLVKEDEDEEREGIGTDISKAADMDVEQKGKADDDHQGKLITHP